MLKVFPVLVAAAALAITASAGSIKGKIVFEGEVPKIPPVDMSADPHCAAMHKDNPPVNEVLVLGDALELGNVLVTVTAGLPEGKTYPAETAPAELTQEGCMYKPRVLVIDAGQAVKFLNPDEILHNVNGMPRKNKPFNRAMSKTVTEMEIVFDQVEDPFPVKCDIHPWMRAFIAVVNNPFHSVSGKDGLFALEGLEPGTYTIQAWHERLGTQTAEVTVPAEGDAEQNFTFVYKKGAK
ncbi:MAG: hypothetical protein AMXMBFR84_19740 [Candidatus Hydrogenedentota bacterium]